jgi:hypothetical protein
MTSHEYTEPVHLGSGLGGTLRVLAGLLVLVLATLGVLAVFDVIELATMGWWMLKIGALALIAAVACGVVWALTRTGHC